MERTESTARLWIERLWNDHLLEVFDDMLAPDALTFGNEEGVPQVSQESFRQQHAMLLASFPDLKAEIHELLANEDRAAALFAATGTQRGKFWGTPATGIRVAFDVMVFFTVKDGALTEVRQMIDYRSILQQIGTG